MRFRRSAPARGDNLRGVAISHGGDVAEGQELLLARGVRARFAGPDYLHVLAGGANTSSFISPATTK